MSLLPADVGSRSGVMLGGAARDAVLLTLVPLGGGYGVWVGRQGPYPGLIALETSLLALLPHAS